MHMRNPWGKHEWTGLWSDSSPIWTPELRRQLGAAEADDGLFFIQFSDYI